MKLEKNFLKNLDKTEYLKFLPKVKKENKQAFTTLALTLVTLSFLGLFAISPTLTTIAALQKELEDNTTVKTSLEEKINSLSRLQQQYTQLEPQIPLIYAAIPQKPTTTLLAGQLQSIAQSANVTLTRLQISEIELLNTQSTGKVVQPSFSFSVGAEGTNTNVLAFLSALTEFDRIVTVETISLNRTIQKPGIIQLSLRGKAYFKQE